MHPHFCFHNVVFALMAIPTLIGAALAMRVRITTWITNKRKGDDNAGA